MRSDDRKAFLEVVIGFAELKGKALSGPALELYWNAMKDWPIEDFRSAATHLVKTCEFMPTPKDFEDLRKAGELTAGEAWEMVLKGVKLEHGTRVHRAAQICGGQKHIRMANVSRELPFIKRDFLAAYGELTEVDTVRQALPSVLEQRTAIRNNSGMKQIKALLPDVVEKATNS